MSRGLLPFDDVGIWTMQVLNANGTAYPRSNVLEHETLYEPTVTDEETKLSSLMRGCLCGVWL
jgi:hypothetical protein